MNGAPAIEVDDLSIGLRTRGGGAVAALSGVSFDVRPGEIVGLVGESGGGKSMIARAIAAMLPSGAEASGRIALGDVDLLGLSEKQIRFHRGTDAALCFQNPRSALSPTRRVGQQLTDRLIRWQGMAQDEAQAAALALFQEVGIRDPRRRLRAFPHELSGGMCQRVMIALALACRPKILLADEPTTGLDATLTRDILSLFRKAAQQHQCGVLLISHDVAAIAEVCDRILVLYAGILVEAGTAEEILDSPQHPYTKALRDAVPDLDRRASVPVGGTMPRLEKPPDACPFADRCTIADAECRKALPPWTERQANHFVRCIRPDTDWVALADVGHAPERSASGAATRTILDLEDIEVVYKSRFGRGGQSALRGVSLSLSPGETLGIVGESGCGKSTLARVIMGLMSPTRGRAMLNGTDITRMSRPNLRTLRKNLQMVFQDPVDSLNPRMTVERNIADPLKMLNLSAVEMDRRIDDVLHDVGLGSAFRDLYPRRLSGGQAQRVALARALSVDPKLIVFDEPTSALDVTVQAQILDLLRRLMAKGDRAYVFVSHDLATVRNLCSRVAVLYLGRVVESGPAKAIFDNPLHPYTRALLESAPSLTRAPRAASVVLARDLDEASPAEGCPLLPRCPFAQGECREPQSLRRGNNAHEVACWKVEL